MSSHPRLRLHASVVAVFACGCAAVTPRVIAPEQRVNAVIVGDSVAAGFSAGRADATLVHRLAALRPAWFVVNYSVGGASMGPYGDGGGFDAASIVPLSPRVVVIMLGSNDFGFGVPLSVFRARYDAFLERVSQLNQPTVVCVTPLRQADELTPNRAGSSMQEYRDAIGDVCGRRRIAVVDGRELLPLESRYYSDFLVHPNAKGYTLMAQHLATELDRYLPAR